MIVYFTGTGNSRYVAQMLSDITGDDCICANEYIKSGKRAELHSERPYVFVSPVYVSAPPRIFTELIRRGEFTGDRRAYFVMTCAGGQGGCPEYCGRLCDEKGFVCMGTNQITMPQNYLVFFKTAEKERCREIIAAAEPDIRALADCIINARPFSDPGMKKWEYISTELILDMYYRHFMGSEKFTAGEDCIGCGKCVRLCPMNNIALEDGRPRWGKSCTHCMACISLCPKQAIEYGRATAGKPRYACPEYNGHLKK